MPGLHDPSVGRAEVRLADLGTFLTIVRAGSISGAARGLRVTPSQVSKAVARLEHQLRVKLLNRGARGVVISDVGHRILPQFEEVLARVRSLQSLGVESQPELTVVAASYLNALFLPRIVEALPELRVRSLDLPPGTASAYATEHSFDVALTTGAERWPASWAKLRIGFLRRALFASPAAARQLGPQPLSVEKLRQSTFLAPIYSHHGQLVPGDDGCPLHYGERRIGHQTQTLALALELAARTRQLVFAPALAARAWVGQGQLAEIRVEGWDVRTPLHLACDAEGVRSRVQKEIAAALREALVE
jgi:DNA-binding transcriptional LysR family regulator